MRLTKQQSRTRWAEIRDLWCRWDPIGVMSMTDWPRDEYDSYIGPTLRLLESGASQQELAKYLADVTLEHMGLTETAEAKLSRHTFAVELREWYEEQWAGSHV